MRTHQQWRDLVGASTRGLTPEQKELAATYAVELEARGEKAAAWHVASMATNTLDRCNCADCRNQRGLAAVQV